MQIWAETGKSALPIRNYSQILYQFFVFTQNLKRSRLLILRSNYTTIFRLSDDRKIHSNRPLYKHGAYPSYQAKD